MSTDRKTLRIRYDDGCLGAHALNIIGDRWALLVVREMMFSPKRFQMIRAGLPGITASVLTQRLAQLVQAGVVSHDPVLGLYTLTEAGRALHPVLRELARWALVMPEHDPTRFISASALMISISATVNSVRAAGLGLKAAIIAGHEGFEITFSAHGMPLVRASRNAQGDFTLEGSGNALAAAIYGPGPAAMAAIGQITLHGDVAAAQEFVDLFSLQPQIRSSSESPDEIEHAPADSST